MRKSVLPKHQSPVTKTKYAIAKETGIPTTRTGRRRKAYNAASDGLYGKYERERAKYNSKYSSASNTEGTGCALPIAFVIIMIILYKIISGILQ